jgi:MFS family permease
MSGRAFAGVTRIFRSLRIRNYLLYFINQLVSMSGTWMQSIALGWLVLHLTGSAFILGLTVALQFGPMLVLGPWGGVIADRRDKRRLLLVTQTVLALQALALGLLTVTGVVEMWMVFILAVVGGVVMAVDNPARQAFVFEMVGPDDLANAVALNSVVINASRIIGPAVAMWLIVLYGLAACFLVNSASFLFIIGAMLAMRVADLHRARPVARAKGQIRDGLRYVRRTPELLVPLVMMAVVSTLGYNFSVLLPLMAAEAFGRGAATYGAMTTAMGIGALAGALGAASMKRPSRRLLVGSTAAFGAFCVVVAVAPTLTLELVALMPMGAFAVVFVATTNSLLQINSESAMRGRVMALWGVVFFGSTPVGGPLAGLLAGLFGPRFAVAFGGATTILAAVGAWYGLRRRRLRDAAALGAARASAPLVCLPDDLESEEAFGEAESVRDGTDGQVRPKER